MPKATDIAKIGTEILAVTDENVRPLFHFVRGQQVLLDADLAAIYGYTTRDFNVQVKNNIDKFPEDFMFKLTDQEFADLKWKNSTSRWGGTRKLPNAFTEQGLYMLMTILNGPIAVHQSIALIRLIKQMKDFILANQNILGQREYLQLSLQTTQNVKDIMEVKQSLAKVDDQVAQVMNQLGEVVTKSELSNIMLDFSKPAVRYGWLILNGQPVESDMAYQQIYGEAKKSIIVIDDYINLKTLSLMKSAPEDAEVTVISDNKNGYLKQFEAEDIARQYSKRKYTYKVGNGVFHDRYIVLDYGTKDEKIYHCGASSKDGGNKVMTITLITEGVIYHSLIEAALKSNALNLK